MAVREASRVYRGSGIVDRFVAVHCDYTFFVHHKMIRQNKKKRSFSDGLIALSSAPGIPFLAFLR